jgi:signal peptidase I
LKMLLLYKVMSGSMEPTIHTGAIVVTQILDPSKLQKGDIISYTAINDASTIVTHRLMDIKSKNNVTILTTKGDANNTPDPDEIDPMRMKGKVIFTIPLFGYLLHLLRKPLGFFLAVIIPALYILIHEGIVMKKLIEKSAIEKYKKQYPATPDIIIIFFLLFTMSFLHVKKTVSYFSSGFVLSGNIISTGHWPTDRLMINTDPAVTLAISDDRHTAAFVVANTSAFDHLAYTLSYDTDTQPQGLTGTILINGNNTITKDGLTLGTCSANDTCTYNTGIKNMILEVTLTKNDNTTVVLTAHP